MSLYGLLFYLIAALMLGSTAMAITRRNLVHTVLFLVLSFFGTAMLFYLLGAPFLAALEIIIYAGAIMILFLFIIMMITVSESAGTLFPRRQALPVAGISAGFLLAAGLLIGGRGIGPATPLAAAQALPKAFGRYLFEHHWLAIEIGSLLLLVALVGALHLGQRIRDNRPQFDKERL